MNILYIKLFNTFIILHIYVNSYPECFNPLKILHSLILMIVDIVFSLLFLVQKAKRIKR